MRKKYTPEYPLIWQKDDFYIEIFCSIPNIATGILITTESSKIIVDPGDGILRDLNNNLNQKEILEISDIFISHGHHDHIGGLWSLLTYFSVMKRSAPINIYFPKGAKEIVSIYKAFIEVYSTELSYKIDMIPIENQTEIEGNNILIEPFKVCHKELSDTGVLKEIPSLGFKFIYKGKSICYGGDTAYCNTLVEKAKGADLAILEAGAKIKPDMIHMTKEEAESIGDTAKEYFLVHVPQN